MASAPRTGRPRDAHIDAAVLEATLDVLDEDGYGGLTIAGVARRAGTTTPAIYRRWPTRQHLVLAALVARLEAAQAPNTGCSLCDLNECLEVFIAAFDRLPPEVIGPLFAECAADPDLRAAFMAALFAPPRAAVAHTLELALARGDLREDADLELTIDLLGSLVHYRVLFGHAPTSSEAIERAVEALLRGIAVDYPSLVEHSRRMAVDHQHA